MKDFRAAHAPLFAMILVGAMSVGIFGSTASAGSPYSPQYRYPSVLDAPHGYGPRPIYGFAGPSYRWGWFGVQYRPRVVHYTGAKSDYWQTGYRWGY